MVNIVSRLKKHPLDRVFYRKFVEKMLHELRYDGFDVSIIFTTNQAIRRLNRDFRGKDKATDVLSFPHHPHLKAGQRIKVAHEDDRAIGDIFIAVDYVVKEAEKYGVTLQQRIELLIAHGVAHLLGHDHIIDSEYRVMRRLEEKLLRAARTA